MIFTKEYSKLSEPSFCTIRKNTGHYQLGRIYKIRTPEQLFRARVYASRAIKKKDITEYLARKDGSYSKKELILRLEKWYGKKYDNFILLYLAREQKEKI